MAIIAASGTFTLPSGPVHRLGFGAMQITGPGVWGPPKDRDEARAVLRRAVELGVDFIDTADSYGPTVSEEIIREALHPFDGVTIATKAGLARTGPGVWVPLGRPEYLRQQCELSCRRLGVEALDLFQLHRVDPSIDPMEQYGTLKDLLDEGKVKAVGLSEVTVEQIEAAATVVDVSTVQNLYNLSNRQSEAVLEHCEAKGIGFIPWFPLATGELARAGGPLDEIAAQLAASPSQVALAWLLARSPVMLPIPGTAQVTHLEQNCSAASLELSAEQLGILDRLAN